MFSLVYFSPFRKHRLFWLCTALSFFLPQFNFVQTNEVVSGRVTDGVRPIQGAIARVAATTISDTTDARGVFTLANIGKTDARLITAWKSGFYNGGVELEDGQTNVEIVLLPLPEKDNPNYQWVDPAPNPALKRYVLALFDKVENCGDCHASIIYDQWRKNGHAQAATNPLFMSLYNGTDAEGNPDVQPGFRLDYPHSLGNCSNCHAPAAAVKNIIGVDMNKLEGVEKLGVSCDFCHKVRDVNLQENTSVNTGVMHMELLRPPDGHQMFFGPYDDVPHPDAYLPLISESIFCAPCHEGGFWGVPIYESYSEWLASPYAEKGITCQDCHMLSDSITTNFAPGRGGLEREPLTIPTHLQLGSRDSAFLASTVEMRTKLELLGDTLKVNVEIKNVGAGHHMPTDQPMRNLILLVRAIDSNGDELKYVGNNRVPYWGGRGNPAEGNYEGLPGKGFAKILYERNPQYVSFPRAVLQERISPAPQWRIVDIKEDNRIPALATDSSSYKFYASQMDGLPMTVTTELIYRRTFKNWAAMKNWTLKDVLLARNVTVMR